MKLMPHHVTTRPRQPRLGVTSGWYGTKVSGTFVTGPFPTRGRLPRKHRESWPDFSRSAAMNAFAIAPRRPRQCSDRTGSRRAALFGGRYFAFVIPPRRGLVRRGQADPEGRRRLHRTGEPVGSQADDMRHRGGQRCESRCPNRQMFEGGDGAWQPSPRLLRDLFAI